MAVEEGRRFRQTFLSRVSLNTQWEIESYERFESELARTGYFHVSLKGTYLQRLWYIWELGSEDKVIDAEKAAFGYFVDLAVEEQVMADPTSPTRPLDEWDPRYFTCLSACFHAGEGTYEEFLSRMGYTSEDEIPGGERREPAEAIGAFGQLELDNIGAMGEVDSLWFEELSPEFQVWQDTFSFTMEAPQPDITSVWTGQNQEWAQQNLQEFNLKEWYSPDTTIDTSWFQYRAMPLPDSMLSPYLQGQRISYLEAAQAHQEYERRKQGRIEELQRQIQWAKRISPAPDESYFYGHGTRLSPEEEELSRLLYGEQQALQNIQRIISGGGVQQGPPVEAWQAAPNFAGDDLMSDYNFFFYYGNPKQVVTELVRRPPGYTPPNTVGAPVSFKSDEFVSTPSGWHPVDQIDYSRGDDSKMIEWIKDFLENTAEERPDLEGYLKRAEEWMERRNIPIPMKTPSNTGDLYNYVPPENEAFNVASSPGFGLPLGGFGAGFLGMPSGGGGKAESSSLSLPSFPSMSLPSVGWGGAAMPAPSIGLSRSGGVSAPAMPAMGTVSPIGMPGGPAIPSSAPSAPVSAQGGPSGGGGGLDFASLLGGSRQSMIPGSQSFAGTETAEASQSISRAEKLVERLMQIPELLAMAEPQSLGSLGSSGKSAGDVSQRTQPQQLVRMVINRHEEISKEKLEQYVLAWLQSHSRQNVG